MSINEGQCTVTEMSTLKADTSITIPAGKIIHFLCNFRVVHQFPGDGTFSRYRSVGGSKA